MQEAVEFFPVEGGGVAGVFPDGEAFGVDFCWRAGEQIWGGKIEEGGVVGIAGDTSVSLYGIADRKSLAVRAYHALLGQAVTAFSASGS